MIAWWKDCGPMAWVLVAGTLLVLIGSRTRLAPWALGLSAVLIAVGLEASCFDGKPHLTSKLDVTFIYWGRSVEIRGLMGACLMILAAPLGTIAGRLLGLVHGGRAGLLVLCPFAAGLLGSSILIRRTVTSALAVPFMAVDMLRECVAVSSLILLGSASVTCIAAAVVARRLLRSS